MKEGKSRKTHWFRLTLLVLIVCGVAGVILAVVQFRHNPDRTYASSTVQFSFKGAGEGRAPNGYNYDVSAFTSDEVLNEALQGAGLENTYTAEDIRANLLVTGQYPENVVQQMTRYVSLLDANADNQVSLGDYRATEYSVRLYNDFDRNIPKDQLNDLLSRIIYAFRARFIQQYSPSLNQTEVLADLTGYDYTQQLTEISEMAAQQSRYAEEMDELDPSFRFNGKSFGDLTVRYTALNSEMDRLNATIILNALSKDQARLKGQYEMEIRTLTIEQEALAEELERINEMVQKYEKDSIIYVSADNALRQVASTSSSTYDSLVKKQNSLKDDIAANNALIAQYTSRLADMEKTAAQTGAAETKSEEAAGTLLTEAETAGADITAAVPLTAEEEAQLQADLEKRIEALMAKKDQIQQDFIDMLKAYSDQEINERTISATAVKYDAPSLLSVRFAVQAVETALPFCVCGFALCLILLICSRLREDRKIPKK